MNNFQEKANFIWSVADLLRGNYKQSEYGKVILPFTVLRRLDCVLAPTKEQVLSQYGKVNTQSEKAIDAILNQVSGQKTFHNHSPYDFPKLTKEPNNILANIRNYLAGFSEGAREIFTYFLFDTQLERLDEDNLLYLIVRKFSEIDLTHIEPLEMGYIFEELIRKFSEISNETAGEHFTPREVIELMVNLLFLHDDETLHKEGIVRTLYDPACGTGGMLSVAERYLHELNPLARLELFGQELNAESYSICKSDMLIKGQKADNIKLGNSFSQDGLEGEQFDYMLSNPPFGVEWKKTEQAIRMEHANRGFAGRFGAGLPRISDGSLLFLQHMISKMKPEGIGSRIAIVFNGSPLFTGAAGSGESEIRRWIIEQDWLEGIIALPEQLFYNTGISTYIWIVSNRKAASRKGKVQLVNAAAYFAKMTKSLGNKRHYITEEQIAEITQIYGEFQEGKYCKIFGNTDFGFHRITVERPLRLNFQVSKERIQRLAQERAIKKLQEENSPLLGKIEAMLKGMEGEKLYKNRPDFVKVLNKAASMADIKLGASLKKALLNALSERDETATICLKKGEPEPDPELRDYEQIPLKESIESYVEREVLPHVPDVWVDYSKTKVGYEINFTRYFYEYKPLRPLEDIRRDIWALEERTRGITRDIIGN